MGTTPLYQLPWPELPDIADGPDGFQDLAVATETAIKQVASAVSNAGNAVYIVTRATDDGVVGGQWGNVVAGSWPAMPPGLYEITSLLYWTSGDNVSCYTFMQLIHNGTVIYNRPYSGWSYNSNADCMTMNIDQIQHGGGALNLTLQAGQAGNVVTLRNGSKIVVTRISDS